MKISKYLASAAFGFLTLAVTSCQSDKTETAVVTEFPVEQTLDTICTVTPEYSEHLTNSINTAGDFFVFRKLQIAVSSLSLQSKI